MRRISILRVFTGMLLCVVSISNIAIAAEQYRFAFLVYASDGVRLGLITPDAEPLELQYRNLAIPQHLLLSPQTKVSPDGEWLALSLRHDDRLNATIRLYNVLSGETKDIATGVTPYNPRSIFQWDMEWAPNSKFLAITLYDGGFGGKGTIYFYSIARATLKRITPLNENYYYMSWSHDSRLLFTTRQRCGSDSPCPLSAEIIEAQTGAIYNVIDFPASLSEILCQIAWSPDNRYITFVSTCDPVYGGPKSELYMVDIASRQLRQVTNFTANAVKQFAVRPVYPQTKYDVHWTNGKTVQVGMWAFFEDSQMNATATSTVTYDVERDQLSIISDLAKLSWSANPLTQQLAYIEVFRTSQKTDVVVDTISALSSSSATISLDNVCRIMWAPDGTRLALTFSEEAFIPRCPANSLRGVGFINQSGSNATTYAFSTLEQDEAIFPLIAIGWVKIR
jgi:WD40 repeat protein